MWGVGTAFAMPLGRAVEHVLADPALIGASIGLVIGDPADPLVAVDPDRRLVPASVTKLVTATAVFDTLGVGPSLETVLSARGPVVDGRLDGDLVVTGAGDPSLGDPDPLAPVAAFVAAVQAAGIREVRGSVVADPGVFAGPPWGRGWMWDDLDTPYSPPVSGLSYARNLATDRCPGRAGPGSPVADPAACLAQTVTAALDAAGIPVRAEPTDPSAPSVRLGVVASAPLGELVQHTLLASDNLYAESLWRLADPARPATADGARAVVEGLLRRAGATDPAPVDGSGLSRYDSLSARSLARVAAWAEDQPWGEDLVARLPVGGVSGTLERRFAGTPAEGRVWAKTGSMTGVRNLVGWVATADGERLPIAVLMNGFVSQSDALRLQDRIVVLVASSRHGRVRRDHRTATDADAVAPGG